MLTRKKNKQQRRMKVQLNHLHRQLTKSRTAIQNIPQNVITETSQKQFIQLHVQLQTCLTDIHQQTYKNKILRYLNQQIEKDLFCHKKTNKTNKKQDSSNTQKIQKQIKQYQLQTDKIQSKCNQQIGKINKLKQQINQQRSQRVVYSNLLKKMQKQIKCYQQIYKQQLILRQIAQSDKITPQISHSHPHLTNNFSNSYSQSHLYTNTQKKINTSIHNITKDDKIVTRNTSYIIKNMKFKQKQKQRQRQKYKDNTTEQIMNISYQQSINNSINNNSRRHTLIFQNQPNSIKIIKQKYRIKQPKFYTIRNSKSKDCDKTKINNKSMYKSQKFIHTKDLLNKINQYTNFIENIKKQTENISPSKLIKHFQQLQNQNKQIFMDIYEMDQKISQTDQKIKEMKGKRKQERIIQTEPADYQNQLILLQLYDNQRNSQILPEKVVLSQKQLSQKIYEIAKVLGLQLIKNSIDLPTEESLQELDEKLTRLCDYLLIKIPVSQKQDHIFSQVMVSCLLSQMQKFASCQKIFDTKLFQAQYYKQIGKRKQIRTRHKIL